MQDLDFSHKVSQVPVGAELKTLNRKVGAETAAVPDIQGAVSNYAEASNWMSSIGSTIAAKSSSALSQKLGAEAGKNPQGDIGISLTQADVDYEKAYQAQAHATLGLQADKLITDSNVELAKVPRITPELIQRTNNKISLGLQNIIKNAPTEIKSQLEFQYGKLQIAQTADLTERMIREGKQDQAHSNALFTKTSSENAYTFGMKDDEKAGQSAIEAARRSNESLVKSGIIHADDAKTNLDTVKKSYYDGKLAHDYNKARVEKREEKFLSDLADKKVPGYEKLNDLEYQSSIQNLLGYINQQNSLRQQDENLRLTKFKTSVALNPLASDMQFQLQDLKQNVSPEAYEKAQLHYVNAVKEFNQQQDNVNKALTGWNNSGDFARLSDKAINKAFDLQVNGYIQQKQKENNPITVDEAEVQVAASAGGRVPVFEKSLENKLLSGNPANIVSASNQMQMLDNMEQGRVYAGVSQKAKAIATLFHQQRGSMPDTDLARQITDNLSNVDEKMQKTLDNSWNLILSSKGAGGLGSTKPLYKFALDEVGHKSDATLTKPDTKFGGNYFAVLYGNDIYNQLNSNFIATRGDYTAAVKMTKDYVDQHYGDTYVNGHRQFTDSPIERYLGYKGNDVTPYVQEDLKNQLDVAFSKAKKTHPTDYWETLPVKNGVVEAIRHINGKQYRYPIKLAGQAGNQWNVVVDTPTGIRSLFLVAPHIGVTMYEPNKEDIDKRFKQRKINHYIGRA